MGCSVLRVMLLRGRSALAEISWGDCEARQGEQAHYFRDLVMRRLLTGHLTDAAANNSEVNASS